MIFYYFPQSSLEEWRFVFWITLGFTLLRTIIYIVLGSAEIQPWNQRSPPNVSAESGIKAAANNDKENSNQS